MARLTIPEVLELLESKGSDERTTILKENDTKSLRHILYSAFHPDVEFALPSERPNDLKIDETPVGISDNTLYQQSRKLKIFMKNTGYDHLSDSKREVLFMQILESVHSTEAELLLQICIDRDIKSSLTYREVSEAFPELLPEIAPEPTAIPEPKVEEEISGENVIEQLREKGTVVEEVKKEPKPEPEVAAEPEPIATPEPEVAAEPEKPVYQDMDEFYDKNKPKKKSKSKKSSKSKKKGK